MSTWKDRWQSAQQSAAAAAAQALAPITSAVRRRAPIRDLDPWVSDLPRQAAINARAREGAGWLRRVPGDWLQPRRRERF